MLILSNPPMFLADFWLQLRVPSGPQKYENRCKKDVASKFQRRPPHEPRMGKFGPPNGARNRAKTAPKTRQNLALISDPSWSRFWRNKARIVTLAGGIRGRLGNLQGGVKNPIFKVKAKFGGKRTK